MEIDKNLKGKMGIYQIVNCINGKKYVGSSQDLYERGCAHFRALRGNYHRNCYLQNTYNKYGKEIFKFEVLEFIKTIEELLPKEQYYIELYNVCNKDKGYNLIVDATRNILSEESKKKISKSLKGRIFSLEHRKKISKNHANVKGKNNPMYGKTGSMHFKSKKIICIETGIIYMGIREAERLINIDSSAISECCRGKRKTAGGYHWKYYKE